MTVCGEFDCMRPELEGELDEKRETIKALEEDRAYWRDRSNDAYARQDIFRKRLDQIIIEARNNISGATEDRSRDSLLTEIIRIAEGRTIAAARVVRSGGEGK